MQCGGGGGQGDFDFYVDVGTRQMDPIQQKLKVLKWIEQNTNITLFKAGELDNGLDEPYRN